MGSATSKEVVFSDDYDHRSRRSQSRSVKKATMRKKPNSLGHTSSANRKSAVPKRKVVRCKPSHHPNPLADPGTDYPQSSTDSGHGTGSPTFFSDTDCCSSTASSDFCAICRDLDLADDAEHVIIPQPASSSKSVQFRPVRMQEHHLHTSSSSDLYSSDQGLVEELPVQVSRYKEWIFPHLHKMKEIAAEISQELEDFSSKVEAAFRAQQDFISFVSKRGKIEAKDISVYLKPTSDKIAEIDEIRNNSRHSSYFHHFSAISESLPALGWVTLSAEVAEYVKEMKNCGKFYSNKVLMEWKGKDPASRHSQWLSQWMQVLDCLEKYVVQFFPGGVASRRNKVVSWPSRGQENITVAGGDHEVDGLHDRHDVVLDSVHLGVGHSVLIRNCSNCSITIPAICSNITMDCCVSTTIHLHSLQDTLKMTNCSSVKIVIAGKVSSIVLDKTDGAIIYLSSESSEVEIVTSSSSQVKVMVPDDGEEKKFVEIPVPQQLKTTIEGRRRVKTVVVENN